MSTRLIGFSFLILLLLAGTCVSQSPAKEKGAAAHPVVKNKPEPSWPKSISGDGSCTIVLRAVFASNGKVTNIHFTEARQDREHLFSEEDLKLLIERAIEAAKQIKFVPATRDGRPVSMWMELQYNFDGNQKSKK